jgi:uncharacterized protein YukE
MSATAVVQFHHRETFERNVTRALGAGALAGAVAFVAQRFHVGVPLSYLAVAGTSLACVRGDKLDRVMLMTLSVLLPALPWLFGFSTQWTVALAGAAAGALVVKSRLAERGEEGNVGAERPGPVHYALTAVTTAGLAVAGTEVAAVLSGRLHELATPALLNIMVSGGIIALFAALGGIGAHVALKADPIDAQGEGLVASLTGEFQTQATRALALYRQCGEQLASMPRDAAREELARTLQRLTRESFDLASEWAGVEAQLHDGAQADLERQVKELSTSATQMKDAVARRQLELAAASLGEELERLGELKLKRERVLAKFKAQVALLERARVSLIGMRSSHATIRAAELTAVSRKLNALALSQADEARLANEVAASSELAAMESQTAELANRQAASVEVPVVMAPVSEPSSAEDEITLPVPVKA